ncbi:PKD domain-containing protein [Halogeometricum luteum]|uniref:Type IV pilin n=1 Tax=Halogeometricum luteum TaxID=2950537 RepID=A0ABU2G171_9EURY|nr:type IV pilin [Halogeometricum sp. S3BR5-2]MDS0294532.1 type IV pilin [Halogeometricum sp. S3BR5-2]
MTSGFDGRGQAEAVGVVLLLGVVVLGVSAFGAFYLSDAYGGSGGATGASVNVVGDVSRDRVSLSHAGGRSVPTQGLRVVVYNGSGRTELAFPPAHLTGGDGDGTFDSGERWRLDWNQSADEELRVDLVDTDAGAVLFSRTVAVASAPTPAPANPARGETPTATPEATDPPSAVARGGTVEGRAGETLTLDGSGTTASGSPTYEWRVVDGAGLPSDAARIVDDDESTPNATFEIRQNVTGENRSVTVELVVSEGSGTGSDAATVEVKKVNRPPVAVASVNGGADDRNGRGDRRWSLSAGASASGGVFEPSAGFGPGDGRSGTRSLLLDSSGDRPTMGGRVAVMELDGSGSYDPDGDELTYRWEVVDAGGLGDALELSDESAVRPVLGLSRLLDEDRTVTVRLTVTDDDGATDTDTVDVGVPADDAGGSQNGWSWWGWLEWFLRLLFG